MRGYNRKGGPKRVAFKIDIQKAYDTVSWSFLKRTLEGFGFHNNMVNWIMQCVTTAAFTLNVNGEKLGSGLLPNNSKSILFFWSLNKDEKEAIKSMLPFGTDKLPVKYLEVPLNAKRLGLIAAVLESIHVYWASVFLLPKTVIKDINRILESFLWNQTKNSNGKAKIAWSQLRGKSIWEITIDNDDSWGWKNLLRIIGPLCQFITYRDLYDERLHSDLKVCDLIENGEWMWPADWVDKFPMITTIPMINASTGDKVVWKTKNGKEVDFFYRRC
ncbi:RNA-directed DNA polymerase, eukaryota, reverse transcriptase zinc-binding domain protein [Tanacetum coccineum]